MSMKLPSSGQVLIACASSVFFEGVRNSDSSFSLTSFFQAPSVLPCEQNEFLTSITGWQNGSLSVYPLRKIAGRKLIQIFTPDPSPYNIWQGRPLASLLAPTCHRTCCLMIQSPIPIKVNHPLENECTVNKVISWCFNFKQIAFS